MPPPYTYRVTEIVKVTDGDTYWLRVDIGFRETLLVDLRLDGWDAPELNHGSDYEKAQGKVARQVASDWLTGALASAGGLWVHTLPDPDDFGRWLGDLWTETDGSEEHLGDVLAAQKLATAWPTRWHEVYDVGTT